MRNLRQNTSRNIMVFMTDSSDHVTGKTGLTLTITASKDGAAFASISPTVTERGNGWYNLALTASHTDTLGDLAIRATGSAADPADILLQVVAYDMTNANSLGLSNLDAAVSTRATPAQVNTECDTALADVGLTTTITGRIDVAVSTRLATAGYTAPLDAAGVRSAVGLASANLDSQLNAIDDFLDTEIASLLSSIGTITTNVATILTSVDTEVAAIKAKTDNLPSDPADASDIATSFDTVNTTLTTIAGYIDTEVGAIKAKTDNLPADPADASDIAARFATVDSALATIDDFLDTEIAAIKAKTDNLPATPASVSDIPTTAQVADKVLGRNLAGGSDGGRTVRDSLRSSRNRVVVSGNAITVYQEDDTTVAWTGAVTSSALSDPVTEINPA